MSFLTAILLMVAVGTVIQKADDGSEEAAESGVAPVQPVRLVDDSVSIAAGQTARIAVLENDSGIRPDQSGAVSVVRAPDCGWIAVKGAVLEYLTDETCVGERRIVYTVPGAGSKEAATVHISVVKPEASTAPVTVTATAAPALPAPAPGLAPINSVDTAEISNTDAGPAKVGEIGSPKLLALDDTPVGPARRLMVAVVGTAEPVTSHPGMPLGGLPSVTAEEPQAVSLKPLETATVSNASAPALGHAAIGGLGLPLAGLPVDASQPPLEVVQQDDPAPEPAPEPAIIKLDEIKDDTKVVRLDPTLGGSVVDGSAVAQRKPDDVRQAALPGATDSCVAPPSTAIDVMRAGRTRLSIVAPCQVGTVAELSYSGIRFALPIDAEGHGEIMTLGYEANVQAVLTFADGTRIDFDLPFKSVDRVSRVALVWDLPIELELNALEFGADPGSEEHVRPENPKSFRDVRRRGGGFLHSFRSIDGVGQNVDVYSHWKRAGGPSGIVRMMIDFASRNRDQMPGTCGSGSFAAPQFLVVRSTGGQLERPILRRLASLDCSEITLEKDGNRLISDGIADLLIQ